jgi:hypothetical protein
VTFNTITPDGKVRVAASMCATCIFRPRNIMGLRAGRVKEMVEESTKNESAIICHSTLDLDEQAVCRGFFDKYPTQPLQIAERLDRVEEVDV